MFNIYFAKEIIYFESMTFTFPNINIKSIKPREAATIATIAVTSAAAEAPVVESRGSNKQRNFDRFNTNINLLHKRTISAQNFGDRAMKDNHHQQ
jgi:hypothetical protein